MEDLINQATAETNTSENWSLFIEICERADRSEAEARSAVQIISKRLNHRNVNVILYSLTLANALVQNCGMNVHREMCYRLFLDTLVQQVSASTTHEIVRTRILDLIRQWAEAFKSKPELGMMVDTYNQLKEKNYKFPKEKKPEVPKTQSAIQKQKEEDELQLAMALSLSEENKKKSTKKSSTSTPASPPPQQSTSKIICRVRALYDFAGLDEGELRLQRNDVVDVYDDTTFKDWWKGELRGKVGIFPANYVEKIPDADVPSSGGIATSEGLSDTAKVDEFVGLLTRIDPRRENFSENERVQELYHSLLLMRPKLVRELEQTRAKQDEMIQLNERFQAACATYHRLMEALLASQRNAPVYQQPPVHYGNFQPPGPQNYQYGVPAPQPQYYPGQ
ncbi:hypothetical protein DFJ73DRAFT_828334 [Zopfochytrium polystomum]|nr:hypothetical protein DFJ73DRAFT_828334 [Zopfochytrium polystomum]